MPIIHLAQLSQLRVYHTVHQLLQAVALSSTLLHVQRVR